MVEQGSHADLMAIEGGLYRRMWEAQNSEKTRRLTEDVIVESSYPRTTINISPDNIDDNGDTILMSSL